LIEREKKKSYLGQEKQVRRNKSASASANDLKKSGTLLGVTKTEGNLIVHELNGSRFQGR